MSKGLPKPTIPQARPLWLALQTSGLPCRSPIVEKALSRPVPFGNDQKLTALDLPFGHQRRLFLRRPLSAAPNDDLGIHSEHSFRTVQNDPASLKPPSSAAAYFAITPRHHHLARSNRALRISNSEDGIVRGRLFETAKMSLSSVSTAKREDLGRVH